VWWFPDWGHKVGFVPTPQWAPRGPCCSPSQNSVPFGAGIKELGVRVGLSWTLDSCFMEILSDFLWIQDPPYRFQASRGKDLTRFNLFCSLFLLWRRTCILSAGALLLLVPATEIWIDHTMIGWPDSLYCLVASDFHRAWKNIYTSRAAYTVLVSEVLKGQFHVLCIVM